MKQQLLKVLVILFIVVAILLTIGKARAFAPEVSYEQKLDFWIYQIGECESSNNPNTITKNDGGSPSYGLLQFKLGTMWAYNKKFNVFPEMTIDNLYEMTMNPEIQKSMAKEIIKHDYAWRNWYNCSRKIGLPPTA